MSATILHGECIAEMRAMPAESIDAVITDPPYGLEFMGKDWDGADGFRRSLNPNDAGRDSAFGRMSRKAPEYRAGVAFQEFSEAWARECLRALKPGGHLLAFGGTRTWHRLAVAVEDAGFEIRDSIAWMYGSGFPKSLDVSKAIDRAAGAAAKWQGWGTALKPAHEPIVVARKPLQGTVAANVQAHGTGALNIDATRIDMGEEYDPSRVQRQSAASAGMNGLGDSGFKSDHEQATYNSKGRWPANVILDEDQAAALDAQSGTLKSGALKPHKERHENASSYSFDREKTYVKAADQGGASRFFYCAKAPKKERPVVDGVAHPTVKPLSLMRWLVRLVAPPGGTVLDPFAGSGTTLEAAILEGVSVIGIEREAEYLPLIQARMDRVAA